MRNLKDCFEHPLWWAFTVYLQGIGRCPRVWADNYCNPFNGKYEWERDWDAFLAGAEAGKTSGK
jgi:hypothetical protein